MLFYTLIFGLGILSAAFLLEQSPAVLMVAMLASYAIGFLLKHIFFEDDRNKDLFQTRAIGLIFYFLSFALYFHGVLWRPILSSSEEALAYFAFYFGGSLLVAYLMFRSGRHSSRKTAFWSGFLLYTLWVHSLSTAVWGLYGYFIDNRNPVFIHAPFTDGAQAVKAGGHQVLNHHFETDDVPWAIDLVPALPFSADALQNSNWDRLDPGRCQGTPIQSSTQGVVVEISAMGSEYNNKEGVVQRLCGNSVSVLGEDSDGAYWLRYCHLEEGSIRVAVGQVVQAGDVLGNCGNTGYSSMPHLHLEALRVHNEEYISVPMLEVRHESLAPWLSLLMHGIRKNKLILPHQ